MVETILPGLHRIEVPLPDNPLKSLNSYVIKNNGRFLIIDTGMNRSECEEAMLSGLKELGVEPEKADFFITHCHVDHTGLLARLATDSATVYFNQREANIINASDEKRAARQQTQTDAYIRAGFAMDELERSTNSHPARRYGSRRRYSFHILKQDDQINTGDYIFRVIETPGHSPSHLCLYEEKHRVLVSGDHILMDITPNIAYWPELDNPLEAYLASLEKVADLEVSLLLPGHRSLAEDHRSRIKEIQEHHQARLAEVMAALEDGPKTAYQVAPWITWDVRHDSWEEFPPSQKWFALGETLSHLTYLVERGRIKKTIKGNEAIYSLP